MIYEDLENQGYTIESTQTDGEITLFYCSKEGERFFVEVKRK